MEFKLPSQHLAAVGLESDPRQCGSRAHALSAGMDGRAHARELQRPWLCQMLPPPPFCSLLGSELLSLCMGARLVLGSVDP